MNLVGGIVVFLVTWWLVLFTVLPWGVSTQAEEDDVVRGTEPGAPSVPALWRKALITTAITMGLWLIIYFVLANHLIDLGTLRSTPAP